MSRTTEKRSALCPFCLAEGRIGLQDLSGKITEEKCPLCWGRGKLELGELASALARASRRFPPAHFEVRCVRRPGGHGDLARHLGAALGLKGAAKGQRRKTHSPGKIPLRPSRFRRWFRNQMTRAGVADPRLWPWKSPNRSRGGSPRTVWGRRRR